MKGSGLGGISGHKVYDSSHYGFNWATEALPVDDVGELLALDSILLVCEGQGDECCCLKLEHRGVRDVLEMHGSNFEVDILKAEGMFCVSRGSGILARTEEEVERHPDAIHDCRVLGVRACECLGSHEDGHGDGFDSLGGFVDLGPGGIHPS